MHGNRLKEERIRLGLTQPQIAESCGVGKNTVINWEKDSSSPNTPQLSLLQNIGVDVMYVLTGDHSITQQPGRMARYEVSDTFSSKKLVMIKEAAAKYGTDPSELMGTVSALVDKEPDFQLSQDERELIELFRAAPLKLKMQVVNALTTGELPQIGGVSVHGNSNHAAGRDIRK